jgi:hypothetical protein
MITAQQMFQMHVVEFFAFSMKMNMVQHAMFMIVTVRNLLALRLVGCIMHSGKNISKSIAIKHLLESEEYSDILGNKCHGKIPLLQIPSIMMSLLRRFKEVISFLHPTTIVLKQFVHPVEL